MRPPESFIEQPVRSLQTMLRVLAKQDPDLISLVPDGIYGPETAQAVSRFQSLYGLPADGLTDQNTWEAIVEAYDPALIEVGPAEPIEILLKPGQSIKRGDENPYLYFAQSMLLLLGGNHPEIPAPTLNGILDAETEISLSAFQAFSDLSPTGILDRVTWKHLVHQFTLMVHRSEENKEKTRNPLY